MITELLKKTFPSYEVELPISKKKYNFRPITVKEEKILLLAQKSNSGTEMARAVAQVIKNCFEDMPNPEKMAIADVEKAFLHLRGKSIGEEASFEMICPETKESVGIKVNLENFEFDKPKNRSNKIKLSDEMLLVLQEPTFSYLLSDEDPEGDDIRAIFKNCFSELQTSGNVFVRNEISEQDLAGFYDLMTSKQLEQFKKYINSIPRMKKEINYTTKDGTARKVNLMGIESFFAFASAT